MFLLKKRGTCPERQSKGFTLIELMVVISIIIILSGLVIVNVSKSRMKARDSERMADLRSIQTALELYFDANKRYPVPSSVTPTIETIKAYDISGNWIDDNNDLNWSNKYLSGTQPHDPVDNDFFCYDSNNVAGNAGTYEYWSNGLRYLLAARFEDINNPESNGDEVIDPRSLISTSQTYKEYHFDTSVSDYCFVLTN